MVCDFDVATDISVSGSACQRHRLWKSVTTFGLCSIAAYKQAHHKSVISTRADFDSFRSGKTRERVYQYGSVVVNQLSSLSRVRSLDSEHFSIVVQMMSSTA